MVCWGRTLAITLSICQLMPAGQLFALGKTIAKNDISVVILPEPSSKSASASSFAANEVRKGLGSSSIIRVIAPEKVESVLKYYNKIDGDGAIKKELELLLAKAKDDFYNFNFVEARSIANKVIGDLTATDMLLAEHGAVLVDAYLTRAVISKAMNELADSREALMGALKVDPSLRIDTNLYPPSIVNLFENCRSNVPRDTASLTVESSPKVAEVHINGILKGVTPMRIDDLPPNDYYVRLATNKYSSVTKRISLRAGDKIKIKETLRWHDGANESATSPVSNYGLKVADILKVDKVVLVSADAPSKITAKIFDRRYKAFYRPVTVSINDGKKITPDIVRDLAGKIKSSMYADLSKNPTKYIDQESNADPALLGNGRRSGISRPVLLGVLGGVLAVGLGAGLAAAFAGGGGGAPNGGNGSVNVSFE